MNIDFYRLVEYCLPPFLRQPALIAFTRALIAKPLADLYASFFLFREQIRYKASVTPQVCMLEDAAFRLLDTDIEITELDGMPIDFLVTVNGTADLTKLSKLLNSYKLAGKTYIYVVGDTDYVCSWKNHVSENLIEGYSCSWVFHVDEDDMMSVISLSLVRDTQEVQLVATANKTFSQQIRITAIIGYTDLSNQSGTIGTFILVLPADSLTSTMAIETYNPNYIYWIRSASVSPTEVDRYTLNLQY